MRVPCARSLSTLSRLCRRLAYGKIPPGNVLQAFKMLAAAWMSATEEDLRILRGYSQRNGRYREVAHVLRFLRNKRTVMDFTAQLDDDGQVGLRFQVLLDDRTLFFENGRFTSHPRPLLLAS